MNFDKPPPGIGMKLVEGSDDQLAIFIPPGGATCRSVGFFTLTWLGIVTAGSTIAFIVSIHAWGRLPPLWVLVCLLFYLIFFGFLYAWLRMRFTTTFIAVTVDQFDIEQTWLGRKKFKTFSLDQNSRAGLFHIYTQNHRAVHALRVQTVDRSNRWPKFATRLSYQEKKWLSGAINNFLRNSPSESLSGKSYYDVNSDALPAQGNGKVAGEQRVQEHVHKSVKTDWRSSEQNHRRQSLEVLMGRKTLLLKHPPSIPPHKLPRDSSIRIELSDNETLAFSYRFKITHPIKYVVTAFFAIFCTLWYGVALTVLYSILSANNADNLFFALIPLLLILIGLVPLSILVFLIQGRAKIKIDHERITGSIGALLLHKTITIPTRSILDVGIGKPAFKTPMTTLLVSNKAVSCIINSSERDIPLTLSSNSTLNDQVAGLVRGHLKFVGIDLPHEGMEAETAEITG